MTGITETALRRAADLTLSGTPGGLAVLLFGSRARGDAGPDSDWDIAVVSRGPDLDGTVAVLDPGAFAEIGAEIDVLSITEGTLCARRNACGHLAARLAREAKVLVGEMPDLGKLERKPRVWPEDLRGWIDSILSRIENLNSNSFRVAGAGVSRNELVRFGRTLATLSADAAERFAKMAIQRRTGTFDWGHDLDALAGELQKKNRDGKWDGPVAVIREMDGQTRRHHQDYPNIRLTARDVRFGLARFRRLLPALEDELADAALDPGLRRAVDSGLAEYRHVITRILGFFPDDIRPLPETARHFPSEIDSAPESGRDDIPQEETSVTGIRVASAAIRALPEMRVAHAVAQAIGNAPDPAFTRLHAAARDGDMRTLSGSVREGADPVASSGLVPLHLAAARDRTDALVALLDAGADREARTSSGLAPLHLAADSPNHDAVMALLDAGADPRAEDVYGMTPLHVAARAGRVEAAWRLLAAGA